MSILVTGGAGYIGAHVVRLLRQRSEEIVVVDDLVTGDARRLDGLAVTQLDLSDNSSVEPVAQLMRDHAVTAVIHFAGRKQVAESVSRPAWYFQQNIGSLANIILAMELAGVKELVFSSSAAVYGTTEGARISEEAVTSPVNPYGESKLVGEHLIEAASRANGLRAASLRYFNVAGAGWPDLGDNAVLNLVPMVFEKLDEGHSPVIFGDDYATADGTCVRDYIHVLDLAEAHLATLDSLRGAEAGHTVYNVGTGLGTSVRDMVNKIIAVSGSSAVPEVRARRPGDPAWVVASPERIEKELGWTAQRGIDDIIASAWSARNLTVS
ncbi:UDP-glucose 4-epimerase GalE [Cryobacterium melibiosiphilum]|uniref:UDP-glucose 4-epimerase n=1 Tax=Cryobacterium melibiosiphilum TaxID=995039 RepID=A0A3A5MCF0_9MICO|nr:UDP-glucose 4-epimerase GalE [Cryobacterium melibiosiphilum]RJT87807.1 UDP-glucose 4-epimerase GalE [Cryobacterium melibiosiphilum]